jgi:signal transduction histidine kinase
LAQTHPAKAASVETDTANMFREPLAGQLEHLARLIQPHLPRLDAALRRHLKAAPPEGICDARQLKALSLITSGAAARLLSAGRPIADFFEQVSYNSRRLAKLNVPPMEVVEALGEYDRELDCLLAKRCPRQHGALQAVRQQLHFRTLLAVNNAYYQVREAETQAFYGLLRAEMDATGLDDLLQRFILILTRTFRAQAGRMIPLTEHPPIASNVLKRLARARYIASGSADEELVLDPGMRGVFQSYWSIPFFSGGRLAGLIQFGFPTPYRWLPRELDLLNAFAERCLRGAERVRLIEDLAAREEQVRSLAAHLLQAEEEERRRIGRELHDEAGQSMLFLRLHLEMLEKNAPADLRPKLAEARGVAERIIAEMRRIIAALHPSAVEELGLPAAIRHLSARFRKLYPIKVRLRLTPYGARLPRETETAIYRVVQECYQNIAKHAAASRVNLLLRSTDTLLELNVEDDGVGFDVDGAVAQPRSFGLKGMRERVALLGGCLEIRSSPGHGATIAMRLPIPR